MKATTEYDFIVVGAGVAGMRASIELGTHGKVLCLAKRELTESNTQYAQGGIAAALSDEDEVCLHYHDTLTAGAGLCIPDAVQVLVGEGPARIEELLEWGTQFDRNGTKLAFTREGAHSRDRVLHAHGDSTGREIGRALYQRAAQIRNITFREFGFTTDLLIEDGRVVGLRLLLEDGGVEEIRASSVLLATGGLGEVYTNTTNPTVATGDGVAIAYRAGAEIADMEFIQFHPTALYLKGAPRFLLSEALRGEGAVLRNAELGRFMPKYHALAELAPRDIVARAIAHELQISKQDDPVVYLDLTDLDGERLKKRFPRIYSTCMEYNIDFTLELVPIRPAAHYAMGGVRTNMNGATNLPGLFAAGEAACTGVHGANRLASNSLLEGLVYGARAARSMVTAGKTSARGIKQIAAARNRSLFDAETQIEEVQKLMWRHAAIERCGKGLKDALSRLQEINEIVAKPTSRRGWEAKNITQTALLIVRSASARLESRGAHYRTDYATPEDSKFLKHSVVTNDSVRFE